ncbi:TonB-dependent receptor [Exilibacterium tricleocarpae]|uniref:TonB-dependent receptor n=1 Tax=Exilibacterium tricleocarpae TaxID=2591008 RepID=A0A545TP15_9GAMM|nr:TonB-dependent receptor [Exilibacterium tricleocarpae]TQV78928.1 TonB-dependent receptor [Exilibacterium tricleocarpae]
MLSSKKSALSVAICTTLSAGVGAGPQQATGTGQMEEVLVLSERAAYANNTVTGQMLDQQSSITSVLAVIDNVPGVLVNEGDVFGSDDWSTTVSIRGFQISLDEQQIGMTIDGIPNGNSNYGGGSKANRFIDTQNIATVRVSQGTADIASKSHEALGGTLDFITQDPEEDERFRVSAINGDFDAKKIYVRYDTGELFGNTRAYFSYSDTDVKTWIDESGETNRTHLAAKFISGFGTTTITGYAAYDDTHEDNYQRVSLTEFRQNADWDRLTGDWSGVPFTDQVYRRGWSTLRENLLAYIKVDLQLADTISLQIAPYYHDNEGRGDWLPPYVVDVNNDGAGNAQSELVSGNTVLGGTILGQIGYVDRNGVSLTPADDCASLTFPYGGTNADNRHLDPACFPADAVPVGSYRHTHYAKERVGLTVDFDWVQEVGRFENRLRAGLWYEDQTREESRDWHKIIDSRVSFNYDAIPYWVQYDREYPQETVMLYIEDVIDIDDFSIRLSGKQWYVDVERQDNFTGAVGAAEVESDSDFLPAAGLLWRIGNGFEVFSGYAENFAAIKDVVLEAANFEENPDALNDIEPETAENFDVGIRYNSDNFSATLTYYQIDFENRITFFAPDTVDGIDFLEEEDGEYRNMGGIETDGIEVSANWRIDDHFALYASYTTNDSTYLGLDQSQFGGDFTDEEFLLFERSQGVFRDNTVFGSVEDMYVISLDWQKGPYRAGLSTKHVGERWLDPQNTQRLDAYDVADMYIAVAGDHGGGIIKGYELRLTINNLFDEEYIGGVAGGFGGWLGAGRTAALALQVDF